MRVAPERLPVPPPLTVEDEMKSAMAPNVKKQAGVSLIEVMIAVVILSIGLLGIAALQAVTLKNSGSSASRTQASIQIYSMLDIIRADRTNLSNYNTNTFISGPGGGTPGTMAGWLDGLETAIAPGAQGRVRCIAASMTCSVAVRWDDSRATGPRDQDQQALTVEVSSQI